MDYDVAPWKKSLSLKFSFITKNSSVWNITMQNFVHITNSAPFPVFPIFWQKGLHAEWRGNLSRSFTSASSVNLLKLHFSLLKQITELGGAADVGGKRGNHEPLIQDVIRFSEESKLCPYFPSRAATFKHFLFTPMHMLRLIVAIFSPLAFPLLKCGGIHLPFSVTV